jgi:hypothetical protein
MGENEGAGGRVVAEEADGEGDGKAAPVRQTPEIGSQV